jgi:hypothetical protein
MEVLSDVFENKKTDEPEIVITSRMDHEIDMRGIPMSSKMGYGKSIFSYSNDIDVIDSLRLSNNSNINVIESNINQPLSNKHLRGPRVLVKKREGVNVTNSLDNF